MTEFTIYSNCPICVQKQPKNRTPYKTKFTSFQELSAVRGRASYYHMQTHLPEIRGAMKAHYKLSKDVVKKAAEQVIKLIRNYGRTLDDKTVEAGLLVVLRHELGGDQNKNYHAKVLGGKWLKDILSQQEYNLYQSNLKNNARIVLRKSCVAPGCWHKVGKTSPN